MNLWFNIPFATMLMAAALSKIPNSTIEAARDAGADRFRIDVYKRQLLGAACYGLVRFRKKLTCPAGHIIYAQIAMYMILSFFTTWFSNPTTWFYLILSGLVYLYVDA